MHGSIDGQAVSAIPCAAWDATLHTKDALRLRVASTGGTREVTVAIATFVK